MRLKIRPPTNDFEGSDGEESVGHQAAHVAGRGDEAHGEDGFGQVGLDLLDGGVSILNRVGNCHRASRHRSQVGVMSTQCSSPDRPESAISADTQRMWKRPPGRDERPDFAHHEAADVDFVPDRHAGP